MRKINILAIVLAILLPVSVHAGGSVSVGVEYNSGGGYIGGGPGPGYGAPITVWPNGRVTVHRPVVTHVYPRGESLIYQNGGQRVYSQGYGGPSTCYVDCWHNGVRPGGQVRRGGGRGNGTQIHVGVGVSKTW